MVGFPRPFVPPQQQQPKADVFDFAELTSSGEDTVQINIYFTEDMDTGSWFPAGTFEIAFFNYLGSPELQARYWVSNFTFRLVYLPFSDLPDSANVSYDGNEPGLRTAAGTPCAAFEALNILPTA